MSGTQRPRVGFDASPLLGTASRGLARVVHETLGALEERGVIEVVRLAPDGSPGPGRALSRWRHTELARAPRELGLAGVHSFTSAFPFRGPGRRVQTVHELPWRHGLRGAGEHAGARHRLWAALGPLLADRVVTATESTAADLRGRLQPGATKLRVVPWGVGPPFEPEPPLGAIDETCLGRYRLPEDPLILCLGATRAKKNLGALLAGVAALETRAGERPHVVVTGRETPDLRRSLGDAQKLGLSGRVTTLDEVEEADLAALYRLAACVPVLSASEGFGLPVLEALACGTPVLVAAGTAQAEVAGDAGIAVDPSNPDAVAAGLARAIGEREALRYVLPERAAEFPWSRTAEGIEVLWRELAN